MLFECVPVARDEVLHPFVFVCLQSGRDDVVIGEVQSFNTLNIKQMQFCHLDENRPPYGRISIRSTPLRVDGSRQEDKRRVHQKRLASGYGVFTPCTRERMPGLHSE